MKLTIEIEMDNAAFGNTGLERCAEVLAVLNNLTARLYPEFFEDEADLYDQSGKVRDTNGNTVGTWQVTE